MAHEEVRSGSATAAHAKTNGASRAASPGEVLDAMAADVGAAPKGRTSFASALRDTVLVAVLAAGGVYYYYHRVTTREAIAKFSTTASDLLRKDDLPALKSAESNFKSVLELDSDNGFALAGLAETYYQQTRHGVDSIARAREFLGQAEVEDSPAPERYATRAHLQVDDGKAAQAETELKNLLEVQKVYHPKLGHAYGRAMLAQDKFAEATQWLGRAQETAFNSVSITYALAEAEHRRGEERKAYRHLEKALSNNMNPAHGLALAMSAALSASNYANLSRPVEQLEELAKLGEGAGPRAKTYALWAEGELALALDNADGALEKVDAALRDLPDFAPLYALKARALLAKGQRKEAIATYELGLGKSPHYFGLDWSLAELLSEDKNDRALELIAGLEKVFGKDSSADFELFRAEHALLKGDLDAAEAGYRRAADLGNDPKILLGLAKVTFNREKAKGSRADLEPVQEAMGQAIEATPLFPEAQAYLGQISLWNHMVPAAEQAFETAEEQYKKLKRPTTEMLSFYDQTIASLTKVDGKIGREAAAAARKWQDKRKQYLTSIASFAN